MTPRQKKSSPAILITNKQKAVRVAAGDLRRLIAFVAKSEGQTLAEVDLAIVGQDEIAGLNQDFLSHRGPTDVLSFDLSEAGRTGIVAQLVVCGPVAKEQGRLRGTGLRRELMLYIVHGLLHLMGYEDHTIRGAARMHAREDEILSEFGVGPTYQTKKPAAETQRRRGKKL